MLTADVSGESQVLADAAEVLVRANEEVAVTAPGVQSAYCIPLDIEGRILLLHAALHRPGFLRDAQAGGDGGAGDVDGDAGGDGAAVDGGAQSEAGAAESQGDSGELHFEWIEEVFWGCEKMLKTED